LLEETENKIVNSFCIYLDKNNRIVIVLTDIGDRRICEKNSTELYNIFWYIYNGGEFLICSVELYRQIGFSLPNTKITL